VVIHNKNNKRINSRFNFLFTEDPSQQKREREFNPPPEGEG
jgi:hypothetical protein